jgi:hypothetical protein
MANQYSESDIRRQLAARQGRGPGGRFLPLSPEQRLSAVRASRVASSAAGAPPIGMAAAAGQPSPLMVSAATLLNEAKNLSIDAEFAESQEAKRIYAKIQVIRKLAQRSADSAAVTEKIDAAIKPVEEQLRKKASFAEFVRERVQEFRKTLPERLVSRIPVVGGLLGGFLRQRREAQEEMGDYERQLLRKGSGGFGGGGRRILGGMGGLSERERQFETTKAAAFPTKTIEAIYKEVVAIRKSVDKIARVSGGGSSSILDSLNFGRRSRIGRLFRRGRLTARRLMRRLRTGRTRIRTRISSAMRPTPRPIPPATRPMPRPPMPRPTALVARPAIGGAAGVPAASSAARGAGGWLSSAWNWTKNAASSLNPMNTIKSAVKSGAGKIMKSVVSLPGLGALISTAIGALDVINIRNDPSMNPEEKKEQIGRTIVGTLGSVIGSIIGGAAGTTIPIPGIGTMIGAMGGAWVGETLAGMLADAVGGRGIYDMVYSIPGARSLISVDEGTLGTETGTGAEGTVTAPATPNTTVGKMANQYAAEQDALQNATASAMSGPPSNPTVNTANVRSNVTNNINNFNDDLRIRNNEPTIRTMQAASHMF